MLKLRLTVIAKTGLVANFFQKFQGFFKDFQGALLRSFKKIQKWKEKKVNTYYNLYFIKEIFLAYLLLKKTVKNMITDLIPIVIHILHLFSY